MNTKNLRFLWVAVALPALLLASAACGGDDKRDDSPGGGLPAGEEATPGGGDGTADQGGGGADEASKDESGGNAEGSGDGGGEGSEGEGGEGEDGEGEDGEGEDGDSRAQLVSACREGCALVTSIGCPNQGSTEDCEASCDDIPQALVDGCFDEMLAFTACLTERPADEYVCNDDGVAVLDDIANSPCGDAGRDYVACSDGVLR